MVSTIQAGSATCLFPGPRAAPSSWSAVDKDVEWKSCHLSGSVKSVQLGFEDPG